MCLGPEIAALMATIAEAGSATAAAVVPETAAAASAAGATLPAAAAYSAAVPAVGAEQAAMLAAQTGDFGLMGLGKTMEAAAGAQGLNPMAAASARAAGTLLSAAPYAGSAAGASGAADKLAMANTGMNLMNPRSQQRPMAPPQMRTGGGQQEPLPTPYGTPAGNSLGGEISEEQKRKLRAMGFKV